MESIELFKPIEINGKKVKKLSYDIDEISFVLQVKAEAEAKKEMQKNGVYVGNQEFDYAYHTCLGMAAIIAVNPEIDWMDLKRIKGRDVNKLTVIGRTYFFGSEELDASTSDDAPDSTPSGTTLA